MKSFFFLLLLFPFVLFGQGIQDTTKVCLDISKVKNLLIHSEKGKIAEQQVQSFINMDSIYIDLSRQFQITFVSQQESIGQLVETNSLGVKVIENGFKDVRADFANLRDVYALKNVYLEDKNRDLEKKVDNRNKTIIILSSIIATGIIAIAL